MVAPQSREGPRGQPGFHPPAHIPMSSFKKEVSASPGGQIPLSAPAPKNCPLVRELKVLHVMFHAADFWVLFSSPQNWGADTQGGGSIPPGTPPQGLRGDHVVPPQPTPSCVPR